ncbi:helix-turn-helix transcriptional regulator [Bacillus gobiensis]|uniref:helix-turn-helix transcriptional regulator n=1 Tax=Bacillus gobiensis TaxID=1441095 RepID=UPI003D23BCFC
MNDKQRRAELADFLRTRRERLSPTAFNITVDGRRRTPGLRREELAQISGISYTWYMKLEQGQNIQVSEQVLESLSQALRLSANERNHLYVLARKQLPLPKQTEIHQVNQELQLVLNSFNSSPAFVTNERWDIVGWNHAASKVFVDYSTLFSWERNLVWLIFTRPEFRELYIEWECVAQRVLALFRASGGHDTNETWFTKLRDQLLQISPEFQSWWSQHDVGDAHVGRKELFIQSQENWYYNHLPCW